MSDTESDGENASAAAGDGTAEGPVSVTIFSDYVCPFCYLGRQSLEQYRETRGEDDADLRIDWHPFDLRSGKRRSDGSIDTSVDDGKDEDYYAQAKENVRRLQEEYDAEMDLEIATDVDSLDAQVVSYYVKEHYPYDAWLAFDEAIFAALWREGEDIGDRDLLVSLAADSGVAPAEVRSALDDDTLREAVTELFEEAKRRGVTGVPTFAYDGHAARGAVPPEHLRRLVEGT
ncbi:DsbA family protein [Halorubrum rubrum]|uniref:DsbA family protein n=1 Tax=Halorubrum rubrum TaxID=1126240 RepID=A0ABD5QXX7_9EURY|nr:DsbA family oxidoreductase [Halorubrum rubrum]